MSDRFAFSLAAVVGTAVLLDLVLNGGAASVFLARKIADMVDYLAFWR